MQYGYFDDAQREYVITNPKTPVKWINYIGTLAFGGFVDHTGGALICKGDPALNRLTKYIPQLPASEFKGETLYLRLHRPGGYTIFSPFFVPTLHAYERYECHVGLGYSSFIMEACGLRSEITVFIPRGAACELRDIRVTNLTGQAVEVDAVPVVEYTHPDALKQFTNADWVPQTMVSRAQPVGKITTLMQYPFMFRDLKINYLTANLPACSFETDRALFLGEHEYGTWANPLSLQQAELSNTQANRGDNIAALLLPLGLIQAGETRRVITLLGQAASLEAARPEIERYRQPAHVDSAFEEMAAFWDGYLSKLRVRTPDPTLDSMLNTHNPRQCFITKNWSRYLSLYQLGLGGSRGIGVRDSSQDVLAVMATLPDEARELIVKLLSVQRRDGSSYHQFNPLNMLASEGDSLEHEDRPHYYSDDHLWAILAVTAYVKETGDLAFLDQSVPYYEKDQAEQPLEAGSVLDHLRRALAFTQTDTGAHGLPLLGFADWNDTVNLPKGAESLFTAHLYGKALLEMIDLYRFLGDEKGALACKRNYETMRKRVNQAAWDGEWYLRYFDPQGQPLGSHANQYGKIYLNGQTWAVISGFATPERAHQALDSAHRLLNTTNGLKLSWPGFNGFDPLKGGITTYPPGAKENGGIFLHTNPWAMIAAALLGDGERAYQYYTQINPAARNDRIEEFECEPYVYPQNILSDEHPQFGLGRNSWLSGTASWAYQAATQYILGLQPTYQGLRIDPCIPAAWDGFHARRVYRSVTYEIEVHNPLHGNRGIRQMLVDGEQIDGNIAPLFVAGTVHRIQVELHAPGVRKESGT
jgi:cellobiose phosphorylase